MGDIFEAKFLVKKNKATNHKRIHEPIAQPKNKFLV